MFQRRRLPSTYATARVRPSGRELQALCLNGVWQYVQDLPGRHVEDVRLRVPIADRQHRPIRAEHRRQAARRRPRVELAEEFPVRDAPERRASHIRLSPAYCRLG